jgi:hypothetical protein
MANAPQTRGQSIWFPRSDGLVCGVGVVDGGYGRGWQAMYKSGDTRRRVFVKTLGVQYSDVFQAHAEKMARIEASVFVHPWFPAATDQPGAASARLLYGQCTNVKTGFDANVFFICGELCQAGELWSHITPPGTEAGHADHGFEERFAKRVFGQVARTLLTMKCCGEEGGVTPVVAPRLPRGMARKREVKGCFRTLPLLRWLLPPSSLSRWCMLGDWGFTSPRCGLTPSSGRVQTAMSSSRI